MCPVCSANIEANFGPVQCNQCQSALFIDFAGNIIVGGEDDLAPPPEEAPMPEEGQDIELAQESYQVFQSPSLDENWSADQNSAMDLLSIDPESDSDISNSSDEQSFQPPSHLVDIISAGGAATVDSVTEEQGVEFSESLRTSNTGDQFFKIIIREIDTGDLRRQVLDSLQDSRLGLVQNEIAPKIQDGTLEIQGLNPIKASFIMNTLKDLPLLIEWEVYDKENP